MTPTPIPLDPKAPTRMYSGMSMGGAPTLSDIDAAVGSNFHINLGKLQGSVIATDGHYIEPPVAGSKFDIAIAQRLDIIVTIPKDALVTKRPNYLNLRHSLFKFAPVLRVFLMLAALLAQGIYAQTIKIAVASNMKPAFEVIYSEFKRTHPQDILIVYGSSGNFVSQIKQGAPFSLFISADVTFPMRLYQDGLTRDAGVVYAIGHLALVSNTASGIKLSSDPGKIQSILQLSNKIAIANPQLAPYGAAAVQYLKSTNMWDESKGKLVYGENISVATMYVSSGAANVGITALSLAKMPELAGLIQYIVLPEGSYSPIKQGMVLMKNPSPLAVEFYDYLQSPAAKSILLKYGYSVP